MSTSESNLPPKKFWNERRANLVFIAVMLVLIVPGATILTLKKLRGPGGNTFPPAVRHQIVFMDPTAGRSDVQLRVVPRQLGDWIEAVAAKRVKMAGDVEVLVKSSGWEPLMSDERSLQLVGMKNEPGEQRFMIFIWDQNCTPISESYTITQSSVDLKGGDASILTIDAMATELLPAEIRTELQNYGFIKPPSRLTWMVVKGNAPKPAAQINFKFASQRVDVIDRLSVPEANFNTLLTDE